MNNDDPMFVCYKSRWSMQIKPRNGRGWLAFALWMTAFFPMLGLYIWLIDGEDQSFVHMATVGFVLLTGIWVFAMTLWMKAHSEIVDLDAIAAERRRNERKGRNS